MRAVRITALWIFLIGLLAWPARAGIASAVSANRPLAQEAELTMLPTVCPERGCAPGQRISLLYDFDLNTFTPSTNPNVMICLFVPNSWTISPPQTTPVTGEFSDTEYRYRSDCGDQQPPNDYRLHEAREATINETLFGDAISISFRLLNVPSSGQMVIRLFENANDTGFERTDQTTTDRLVTTTANRALFVANDVNICGANSPCYLNSADDLPGGLGTGLRDAVEAVEPGSEINIIGDYTIKGSRVTIDKQITLKGIGDASLTYTGTSSCAEGMLLVSAGVTIRELNINDGSCSNPNRNLDKPDLDKPAYN